MINFFIATALAIGGISFSALPVSVPAGEISERITITSGEALGETGDLFLTSSSGSGEFSSSATNWESTDQLTWNSNWSNRSFYYRDSAAGEKTITARLVTRESGQSWQTTGTIRVLGAGEAPPADLGDDDSDYEGNDEVEVSASSSGLSAHSSPAETSSASTGRSFKVSAGRERVAAVNSPVIFTAAETGANGRVLYRWSFGDGTAGRGGKIRHSYHYPGTYIVVLNARDEKGNEAVARTEVRVADPRITLEINSQMAGSPVEITNGSTSEINIAGWRLSGGETSYVFPDDTILTAGQKLTLPREITGLDFISNATAALFYPNGKLAGQPQASEPVVIPPVTAQVIAPPARAPARPATPVVLKPSVPSAIPPVMRTSDVLGTAEVRLAEIEAQPIVLERRPSAWQRLSGWLKNIF